MGVIRYKESICSSESGCSAGRCSFAAQRYRPRTAAIMRSRPAVIATGLGVVSIQLDCICAANVASRHREAAPSTGDRNSKGVGDDCPADFPWAINPAGNFNMCCASPDDCYLDTRPAINSDPDVLARSDCCLGHHNVSCPLPPCSDYWQASALPAWYTRWGWLAFTAGIVIFAVLLACAVICCDEAHMLQEEDGAMMRKSSKANVKTRALQLAQSTATAAPQYLQVPASAPVGVALRQAQQPLQIQQQQQVLCGHGAQEVRSPTLLPKQLPTTPRLSTGRWTASPPWPDSSSARSMVLFGSSSQQPRPVETLY